VQAAAAAAQHAPDGDGSAQHDHPVQVQDAGQDQPAADAAAGATAASAVADASPEHSMQRPSEQRGRRARTNRPPKLPQTPSADPGTTAEARRRLGQQLTWQLARQADSGSVPHPHVTLPCALRALWSELGSTAKCVRTMVSHMVSTIQSRLLSPCSDQRNAHCRRLLSKRELWSAASDAASCSLKATVDATENGHHDAAAEPATPELSPDGGPSRAAEPAPTAEPAQREDAACHADGQPQAAASKADEGPVAGAAAPARRMGGRPLDAGRVLEVAVDPVTGCAPAVGMHAPAGCLQS